MTIKLSHFISGSVSVAALVQLVPLAAAFQPAWLVDLYGVAPSDATLILLLRHRAVLLGLVGAILLAGVLWRALLGPALAVGLVSKLSYLLLYAISETSPATARVARVDAFTAALLLAVVGVLGVLNVLKASTRRRLA